MPNRIHNLLHLLPLAAATALAGCATNGQPTVGLDPANRVIDVRADEQVRRLADHLTGLNRFRFETDITYDEAIVEAQHVQYAKHAVVDVQRPNRCRSVVTGDIENKKYWYDGKQVVSLDVDKNCYATFDVPDTIDGMIGAMAEKYNVEMPLAELIVSNLYDWLMEDVITARYVGASRIGGVACHHLAFEQEALNWELWLEDGERPFPRKLLVTYKNLDGRPQYEAAFSRWDAAPTFSDQDFVVALPPNAVKIDTPAPAAVTVADETAPK